MNVKTKSLLKFILVRIGVLRAKNNIVHGYVMIPKNKKSLLKKNKEKNEIIIYHLLQFGKMHEHHLDQYRYYL